MSVVGDDTIIVDEDESNKISSDQTLTKQEKNVEIQVRRVRQSIDLDIIRRTFPKLHCNIIILIFEFIENIYSYKFFLFCILFPVLVIKYLILSISRDVKGSKLTVLISNIFQGKQNISYSEILVL